MQATVIETEQEQEPQIHLWSIADYHQMIEVGVLDEDDRVELLEGKIVCMSPQRPFHAASVQRSSRLLFKLLGDRAEIRIQLPVTLGNDSEPEPDIAVVRFDENEYSFRHPEAPDIYLYIGFKIWLNAAYYTRIDIIHVFELVVQTIQIGS